MVTSVNEPGSSVRVRARRWRARLCGVSGRSSICGGPLAAAPWSRCAIHRCDGLLSPGDRCNADPACVPPRPGALGLPLISSIRPSTRNCVPFSPQAPPRPPAASRSSASQANANPGRRDSSRHGGTRRTRLRMTGSGKTAAFLLPILHRLIDAARHDARAHHHSHSRTGRAGRAGTQRSRGPHTDYRRGDLRRGGHGPQEHAFRSGVDV